MALVGIGEFLHLTKMSDSDLIAMLENGELVTETGEIGELLIDVDQLSPESIASRSAHRTTIAREGDVALLQEMIASEVVSSLDEIVEEALELASRWAKTKNA